MRLLVCLFMIAAALLTTPSLAQNNPTTQQTPPAQPVTPIPPASTPVSVEAPPFTYRLGQTTLQAARDYWSQNGMQVLGEGHLALGTGSGMDGGGGAAAEKVLLVDVTGIDFEGISTARFGFYEDKLYRIQASLAAKAFNGQIGAGYTEAQIGELVARLRKKYGNPNEVHRTFMAGKKPGNDIMIWNRGKDRLILTTNTLFGSLVFMNNPMELEIKRYIKVYCRTVNTKNRIVCW